MNTSEKTAELAKALSAAQAEFRQVQKSGKNKFDNYSYAKLEDYIDAIGPILPKHGLSHVTSVEEVTRLDDRTTKNQSIEHAVQVKVLLRLMHVSGEWIETPSFGEGQDRGDKAIYKAVTGARKYGLASALGLATTDDPEADEPPQQKTQEPKPQARTAPRQKPPEQDADAIIRLGELINRSSDPVATNSYILAEDGIKSLSEMTAERMGHWIKQLEAALAKKGKSTVSA